MRWLCLVLLAGCYSPQYAPGGKCTSTCPGDLECVQGTCVLPGTLPNDPVTLSAWISDPQRIKPGVNMPAHVLPGADLQALVAYLGTLK